MSTEAELLQLIDRDIADGRRHLQDSHNNLEKVAAYCEGNYLQVSEISLWCDILGLNVSGQISRAKFLNQEIRSRPGSVAFCKWIKLEEIFTLFIWWTF